MSDPWWPLPNRNQIRADQCERATEFLRSLLVGLGGACIDDAIEWRLSLDSFASEGTKLLRLLRSLVPRLCRPIWVVKMFFSISWRASKGLKRAVLAVSWSERSDFEEQLISLLWTWEIEALETSWDQRLPFDTAFLAWSTLTGQPVDGQIESWCRHAEIARASVIIFTSLIQKLFPIQFLRAEAEMPPKNIEKHRNPILKRGNCKKNIGKHTSHINFQKYVSFLSFLSAIPSTNMMDHGWQVDNQMLWGKQLAEHEEFGWHQWRGLPSWRSQGVKAEVHGGLWIGFASVSLPVSSGFRSFDWSAIVTPLSVNYKSDRRSELVKSRRMDSTICTAVQNEVIANTMIQIMHEWSRLKWTIKSLHPKPIPDCSLAPRPFNHIQPTLATRFHINQSKQRHAARPRKQMPGATCLELRGISTCQGHIASF